MCIVNEDEIKEVVEKIDFPLVFKPLDGNHGKGASVNIKTLEEAFAAFHHAKKYSRKIIVEKFITGYDYRVLVINNRFIAAALREPAHVIGNGKSFKKLLKASGSLRRLTSIQFSNKLLSDKTCLSP